MANKYSQIFTLKDIFNNPKLKNKIPLINYKEKETENGKISVRTNAKTVNRLVFDTATDAARPFYKPLNARRSGDTLVLGGELVANQDVCVDAVYWSLLRIRQTIGWTANNADMIRDALKESEKNKRERGIDSKLFLRCQSMAEIEGMSRPQLQQLMNDIVENIVYGDNFPKTQKKWEVQKITDITYTLRKVRWKYKVGDV